MTEAQRGTITHNVQGVSLTGERQFRYEKGFYFQIDGCYYSNNFSDEEWTFTPDKPSLPTKPGFYRPVSELDWTGVYHLNIQGEWSYINGHNGVSSHQSTEGIKTPLVRLIPETTDA